MLEVLRQDYVQVARSKGLDEKVVIFKHVLRNSLIPQITLLASLLPALLGGSVIIETIFSIPGLGQLGYESVLARDYPTVMALFSVSAILTLFGILLSDLLLAAIDPRIAFGQATMSLQVQTGSVAGYRSSRCRRWGVPCAVKGSVWGLEQFSATCALVGFYVFVSGFYSLFADFLVVTTSPPFAISRQRPLPTFPWSSGGFGSMAGGIAKRQFQTSSKGKEIFHLFLSHRPTSIFRFCETPSKETWLFR